MHIHHCIYGTAVLLKLFSSHFEISLSLKFKANLVTLPTCSSTDTGSYM